MVVPGSQANRRQRPEDFDTGWLEQHLGQQRRAADLLSEIREVVFGAQDGVLSTLAVTATVGTATGQTYPVLIAGFATMMAGVFAMGVGEYMSSKSQREVFQAQIAAEAREVEERPAEAQAEVGYLLHRLGLSPDVALRVAQDLATNKRVLLKIMVEQELGLIGDSTENVLRGALAMGGTFGVAGLVPLLPYLALPVGPALFGSVLLTVLLLFGMGVLKSHWTRRGWLRSGLETFLLGALAGIAGYVFGSVLPGLLGVMGVPG